MLKPTQRTAHSSFTKPLSTQPNSGNLTLTQQENNPESLTGSQESNESSMQLITTASQAEKFRNCLNQAIDECAQQLRALTQLIQRPNCCNNNDIENGIENPDAASSPLVQQHHQSDLHGNISRCLLKFRQIVSNNEHIFFEAAYGIFGYTGANIANEKISDEEFNVISQVGMQIAGAAGAMIIPFILYTIYARHTDSYTEENRKLHLGSMGSVGYKQIMIGLAQNLVPNNFSNLSKTLQTLIIGSSSGAAYYIAENIFKIVAASFETNRTDSSFTTFKKFVLEFTGGLILNSTAGSLPGISSSLTQTAVNGNFSYMARGAIEGVATTIADLANLLIGSVTTYYGWPIYK